MYAGFEAGGVGIKVDADAPRSQTPRCANADDTGIAFDERQLVQFCEIVHFSDQKLSEPRCDNAIAVVIVHFGGVEQ